MGYRGRKGGRVECSHVWRYERGRWDAYSLFHRMGLRSLWQQRGSERATLSSCGYEVLVTRGSNAVLGKVSEQRLLGVKVCPCNHYVPQLRVSLQSQYCTVVPGYDVAGAGGCFNKQKNQWSYGLQRKRWVAMQGVAWLNSFKKRIMWMSPSMLEDSLRTFFLMEFQKLYKRTWAVSVAHLEWCHKDCLKSCGGVCIIAAFTFTTYVDCENYPAIMWLPSGHMA